MNRQQRRRQEKLDKDLEKNPINAHTILDSKAVKITIVALIFGFFGILLWQFLVYLYEIAVR